MFPIDQWTREVTNESGKHNTKNLFTFSVNGYPVPQYSPQAAAYDYCTSKKTPPKHVIVMLGNRVVFKASKP